MGHKLPDDGHINKSQKKRLLQKNILYRSDFA